MPSVASLIMRPLDRYLLLLFLSPLVLFTMHVILIRGSQVLNKDLAPQVSAVLAASLGWPVIGFLAWRIYLGQLPAVAPLLRAVVYGALVYSCMAYSYFHFFNMTETSRRYKIMCELWLRNGLRSAELEESYRPENQVPLRLKRMTAMDQIRQEGDRYFLKSMALCSVGLILVAWGKVIGFDTDPT